MSLVHKRLVELKPEMAIAYVSHNKYALSIADYVYVLRKGQVIFAGKPAELSRQNYHPNYDK